MPRTTAVPDLTGRLAVVTGASDGIGLELAARLAAAGAEVVLPVRDPAKGERALTRVRERAPAAVVSTRVLDLASLASVEALGRTLVREDRPVHLLVANAGVMAPATRHETQDGFELQLGTNHLGHVALVGHLLPLLRAGGARVTSTVSFGARGASLRWDDLQSSRAYKPMQAYGQSKLAQMLWALELDRRSAAGGWGITSNVAHPGLVATGLQGSGPNLGRARRSPLDRLFVRLSRARLLVQRVDTGVLPVLHAATDPSARGGAFYGPDGWGHLRGAATEQEPYRSALDADGARRVWEESERLTGVRFPADAALAAD